MDRVDKLILIIGTILVLGLLTVQYLHNRTYISSDAVLIEKLDNLERKIDIISNKKDSIRVVIETVDKEIITNEKHYEEVVNNIISQPHSFDSVFAENYIKRFIDERTR